MKANPGGQIPLDEIIGRDELINKLWSILEGQSLVLCAERRMGKTCVIRKMENKPHENFIPIYRDLESVETPIEFVDIVYHDVKDYLSKQTRTMESARKLLSSIGGTEIGDYVKLPDFAAPHWKKVLENIFEDLAKNQKHKIIFFWDELPLMLYKIKQKSEEKTAMELLDVLRFMRQTYPELRMVFTGSIGLHNVLTSLKRVGYSNDPTNDMYTEDVPTLSPEYAQKLAQNLLEGEDIKTGNIVETSKAIGESVDRVPYYIHHVISQMKYRKHNGIVEDQKTVSEIVKTSLTDSFDRWHMKHYLDRLNIYYTSDELPFALGFLDILAMSDQPLTFGELFNRLKSNTETENKEIARSMLTLLQRDHYIIQNADGTYQFRFQLIKNWWRLQRGDDQ